jgi:phage tail sheath protein FI
MPEYLSPGVYVEEVSFRSKSIEGVPTSTTGYTGLARSGPVYYPEGPSSVEARLITSFTEFERIYGGLEPLGVPTIADERTNYMAHAARAFFMNGGRRLYVSRVFAARGGTDFGVASFPITVSGTTATWRARWPGAFGNVWVDVKVVRTKNVAYTNADFGLVQAKGVKEGGIVEIIPSGTTPPDGDDALTLGQLAEVTIDDTDGHQIFNRGGGQVTPAATDVIQHLQLQVDVRVDVDRRDTHPELATSPEQKRYIGKILDRDDPEDEAAVVWLDWDPTTATGNDIAANLMVALHDNSGSRLTGGHDGDMPPADGTRDSFAGMDADPDDATVKATGLAALGEIDDIAIVAMPDSADLGDEDTNFTAAQALISHCENLRYRIAVVDGPVGASMTEIREYRGRFDTKYGAIYHPWVEILDPNERPSQGAPPSRILLPPSGFVTGIYARSDIERGVHKAPANEVVRGLTRFELNINKGRQDVLNPEGINALRFFEGRGNRVWGARTMSSDPEWKYVNVRRLFIYIEHSIDKGTQWAVFEPNNDRLWANVRSTIEDFLLVLWRDGALLGTKPEEAYFVRCDRTTMTQNDLDNGRLICLVGVAPVKPAEFVIFRIGQWTADAKVS